MVVNNYQIYRQKKLTFILLPDRILVKTPLQIFTLEPKTRYWKRRVANIRAMIMLGEIRNLDELSNFCAHGNVEWITTSYKYHAEKVGVS